MKGLGPFVLLWVALSQLNFVKPWGKQGEAERMGLGWGQGWAPHCLFQSSGERKCGREVPGELFFLHKNVLLLREGGCAWNLVSPGPGSDLKTPFKLEAALCLTFSVFLVFLSRFYYPEASFSSVSPPPYFLLLVLRMQ